MRQGWSPYRGSRDVRRSECDPKRTSGVYEIGGASCGNGWLRPILPPHLEFEVRQPCDTLLARLAALSFGQTTMAMVSPLEWQLLKDVLGFDSGYVLDLSNSDFTQLFAYCGTDVDDARFCTYGTSKGKRFRRFVELSPDAKVAKVLEQLWEHRESNRKGEFPPLSARDRDAFSSLLARLQSRPGTRDPSPRTSIAPIAPTDLDSLAEAYTRLRSMDPHARGTAFEKWLYRAFALFGLDPREDFRNRGEQIDGSFQLDSHTYLLEAKWHGPRLGAELLHAFQGKVGEKSTWSRGLFISESGFTPVGLEAFGRCKQVICMDGLDIHDMLERRLSLVDVLRRKVRRASESGRVFEAVRDLFP